MSELAIVIPAYHSQRTIGRCLERFSAEAPGAEIVVVDSAPGWESAAVAARFPHVRVIRSADRLLPHAARNRGARESASPLLLFTDPDIYPRRGAVAALVDVQRELGGGVIAAIASHGRSYVDLAAHTVKFGPWLPRRGVVQIDDGPSSGLLVPRAAWLEVGGIPEDGMLGDTMFCWALGAAGVPLHLAGEAVFEHDHATTIGALTRERFARGREFAALRRGRWPGSDGRVRDIATTVSMIRPARVTLRSASTAWRLSGRSEAVLTLPVVASAQVAWFVGELAGVAQDR
jgi:GT2 family glycosyltransferase